MATRLSDHFTLEEFIVSGAHPELAVPIPEAFGPNVEKLVTTILEPMRVDWDHRFLVLSGYRSPALNKAVGGSPTSQHATAAASDITTADIRALFYYLLLHPNKYPAGQIIYYPKQSFIHVALPSRRYPTQSYFVSPGSKRYIRVKSVAEAMAAGT